MSKKMKRNEIFNAYDGQKEFTVRERLYPHHNVFINRMYLNPEQYNRVKNTIVIPEGVPFGSTVEINY